MFDKLSTLDWGVIALFLLGMLALGGFLASRIGGFKEYFLAGGALSTPLLICTLVSTYYGLDVTFGTSESGFYYGLAAWFWYSLPYYFFIAFAAVIVARRLRRYDAMTLPDLLDQHYGSGMRMAAAAACFIYSAPILAIGGMMALLEWAGVPTWLGLVITIGVCGAYTVMGGLWADTLSDTIQFVLMCVTLAFCLPAAVTWVGGWDFIQDLPAGGTPGESPYLMHHGGLSPWVLASWALTGTTVLVEPAFYQRVFAARDTRAITRALLMGIVLWAAYDWIAVMLGMIAQAAVQQGLLDTALKGKEALLEVGVAVLPFGLRGVLIGGIISAAMSTIDSYSLLAAGNLVYDIGTRVVRRPLSDRQLMWATRGAVVLVLVISLAVSMAFERLRDAWQFMAAILSAVVLVPTMAALFLRPARRAGLWAAAAGFVGLVTYYATVRGLGVFDADEESFVLRIPTIFGMVEVWQSSGIVAALPCSLLGWLLAERRFRHEPRPEIALRPPEDSR